VGRACARAAGEEGGDGVELAVIGDTPRCCMYARWEECLDGVLGAERDIVFVFDKGSRPSMYVDMQFLVTRGKK